MFQFTVAHVQSPNIHAILDIGGFNEFCARAALGDSAATAR
jgi:hypothetical protein